MNLISYNPTINTFEYKGYQIGVLRLDAIHPDISGNKWFKLKYNLEQAIIEKKDTLLTFGGAYSNHIVATAAACRLAGLKSIGIIRGEKIVPLNPTLSLATAHGMDLEFVSRQCYQQKQTEGYLQTLQQLYPQAYIVPEGGDNALGEKGCSEILTNATNHYQHLFCAYGTGTTFKGLAASLQGNQNLTAIHALNYLAETTLAQTNINNQYHFGGYAKHNSELLDFKKWFEQNFHIPLDYVYTAKLFYAVFDLINQQKLNVNEPILIIHSGGLQGNKGYEERLKNKKGYHF